jgi:hypothetical protein
VILFWKFSPTCIRGSDRTPGLGHPSVFICNFCGVISFEAAKFGQYVMVTSCSTSIYVCITPLTCLMKSHTSVHNIGLSHFSDVIFQFLSQSISTCMNLFSILNINLSMYKIYLSDIRVWPAFTSYNSQAIDKTSKNAFFREIWAYNITTTMYFLLLILSSDVLTCFKIKCKLESVKSDQYYSRNCN